MLLPLQKEEVMSQWQEDCDWLKFTYFLVSLSRRFLPLIEETTKEIRKQPMK